MLLSEYDRVVALFVDRRYRREQLRVAAMLIDHGVRRAAYREFIDGDGTCLPHRWYDQITLPGSEPAGWVHGKGAWAHSRAMRRIVEEAWRDGVGNLLFVEDDCVLTDEFDDVVRLANGQLERLPPWDLLYYGANHTWATTEELAPNVLRCHGSYTTHCLGIPGHMFETIAALPAVHVIDNVIAGRLHPGHNCYAVFPNIAVQQPGYSYLSNCNMDYTDYFKSRGMNWR